MGAALIAVGFTIVLAYGSATTVTSYSTATTTSVTTETVFCSPPPSSEACGNIPGGPLTPLAIRSDKVTVNVTPIKQSLGLNITGALVVVIGAVSCAVALVDLKRASAHHPQ